MIYIIEGKNPYPAPAAVDEFSFRPPSFMDASPVPVKWPRWPSLFIRIRNKERVRPSSKAFAEGPAAGGSAGTGEQGLPANSRQSVRRVARL